MNTSLRKAFGLAALVSITQASQLAQAAKEAQPGARAAFDMAPVSKAAIEMPVKNLVSLQSKALESETIETGRKDAREGVEGKTVLPGKVNWHKSLSQALDRSRTSGKPVLLFYMLGSLDKEFC